MNLPLQVVFRGMENSPWIEDIIIEKASKLDRFCDHITSCRVVVDMPHRHHHTGNMLSVSIDISAPGKHIIVNKEPDKDISAALRDAFDSARRQLETYVQEQRRHVKTHEYSPRAHIKQLFPEEEYGFIETIDGREVYFHGNSVIGENFDHLKVGDEVTFVEEAGEKGPQASTVRMSS